MQWRVAPTLHWTEAFATWLRLDYIKHGGGELSDGSRAALMHDLQHWSRWYAQACGRPSSPEDLTPDIVRRYFDDQAARKVKANSRNRRLASLRTFVKWCLAQGLLSSDPTLRQQRVRQVRLPRRAKTDDEMNAVETVAVTGGHVVGADPFLHERDFMIWMLFKNTTLRIHSIAALDLADIDGRILRVVSKGGIEVEYPINDELAAALDHWRTVHAGRGAGLLINQAGRRLTAGQIRRRLYAMAAEAGVSMKPHDLRHTRCLAIHRTAQELGFSAGEALDVTATLMGHMDRRTTLGYLRASAEELVEVNNKA